MADRYWVGGSGNWNDTAHWSTSSGGAGGASVPNTSDNVYIDENSDSNGLNINLNVNLNCQSLIITPDISAQLVNVGNISLESNIYGDISINSNITFLLGQYNDMFLYSPEILNIGIDTSAFRVNCLRFMNSNTYRFVSDLSSNIIIHTQWSNANINFNDHDITCREIKLVGANNVNLGNSKIIINDPYFSLYLPNSVSEGNSTIILNQGSGNNIAHIDKAKINNLALNGNLTCGFGTSYYDTWIKNLIITPGSEIRLTSKTSTEPGVQTFHIDNIIALGTSDSSITLRATTAGTPFHIITTEDSYARIRYCHITDASVSPTTIWRAVNSVNGGNNRGIIFTNQDYDYMNYYWVNDGGSWNDSTHWSPISGGIPGAYTITSSDNLIFDLHSFSTDSCIYTHIDVSSFKSINMSTIDQSVYLYVENDLNCYGDFTLSPRLSLPYRPYRSFNFYGQGDTYIHTYGIPLMTNYVCIYDGNYILLSDLIQGNSSGTLYNTSQLLIDSSLDMNNFNVKTWNVYYDLTPGGTLYMRSGMLTAHNVNFYRMHVIPGTSTIKLINELTASSDRGEAFGDIWHNPKRYNRIWFSGTPGTGYPYTVDLTAQDGSLYVNEIKIDPGINVTFDRNSIINVRKFIAHGTKDGSIQVFSDTPGSKFTLNCTGDYDVQADYLYVRDCSAIPLNAWSAGNHGVDLGNNTGWKFRHHRDIPPLYYKSNLLDKFRYEDVWGYGVREPYCPEYMRVYNAMSTKPNSTLAQIQNNFIITLINSGIWHRMDLLYNFMIHTNDASEAYINWINPGTFDLTDPSGTNPEFNTYRGITGDYTTDWLNTNFIPVQHCINSSTNSFTLAAYINTFNTGGVAIGAASSASPYSRTAIQPTYSATVQRAYINSEITPTTGANPNSLTGLHLATRVASNRVNVFINDVCTGTSTVVSNRAVNQSLTLLAQNVNGTSQDNFFGSQMGMAFVMDGVTPIDVSIINNAIKDYKKGLETFPEYLYGPEIVENGTFDTNDYWRTDASPLPDRGWSIQNGKLVCAGTSPYTPITLPAGTFQQGVQYIIFCDVDFSSGTLYFNIDNENWPLSQGHNEHIFTYGGGNYYLFQPWNIFVGTIDNVSIRRYYGA